MKELKNVITINDFNYSQGGASKVAIDTANLLAEKGLASIFISAVSDDKRSALKDNVVQYKFNGKEFLHYENKIQGMLDGLKYKDFSDFVRKVLEKYDAEDTVVHIHGWTKACSSDFFNVLRKKGFKTFLTLHDYFTICPNGAMLNYKTQIACTKKCLSLQCILTNCDSRNYIFKLYRCIRQYFYNKDIDFDNVIPIFISEFQKEYFRNNFKCPESNVIPNPVQSIGNIKEKKYDFVYIGRNSKEKGLDLFIKLAMLNPDFSFLIVGDYKVEERTTNLSSTGWVSENEVDEYLRETGVLVLPSLLPEPLGLNVVKAVNAGIPCLVSSNTGAVDYIEPGINGLVFKQGSLESLNKTLPLMVNIKRGVRKDTVGDYYSMLLNLYKS